MSVLGRQRVVVQLYEEKGTQKAKPMNEKSGDTVELEVVDNHRLQCSFSNMPRYDVSLDYIGLKNGECTKNEISNLIRKLIIGHVNCSVFRFAPARELDLQFLHKLFIHELEKFMQPLNNVVQMIVLKYHDIRRYDLIGLSSSRNLNTSFDLKRKPVRKRRSDGKEFLNSQEFFRWLNKDFIEIWSRGKGHDLFELEILYNAEGDHVYCTKMSLIQIYLSKLELQMKANLHTFFQFHSQKSKKKPLSSLITDCIEEYAYNANEENLFIFDIPINKTKMAIVREMLELAQDAYIETEKSKLQKRNPNVSSDMMGDAENVENISEDTLTSKSSKNITVRSIYHSQGASTRKYSSKFCPNINSDMIEEAEDVSEDTPSSKPSKKFTVRSVYPSQAASAQKGSFNFCPYINSNTGESQLITGNAPTPKPFKSFTLRGVYHSRAAPTRIGSSNFCPYIKSDVLESQDVSENAPISKSSKILNVRSIYHSQTASTKNGSNNTNLKSLKKAVSIV